MIFFNRRTYRPEELVVQEPGVNGTLYAIARRKGDRWTLLNRDALEVLERTIAELREQLN